MKVEIKRIDGRWLINGKPYHKATEKEMEFFNEFFLFMKQQKAA